MTDLRFASWAQTRLGTAVETADTMGALTPATFRPAVTVQGPTPFEATGPTLRLLGPGGVAGLDRGLILRRDPPPGAIEVEDNYLASIDFRLPELPWLLTPAHADARGRLRPWLVLVVVEASSTPRRPLPIIEVSTDELPDLSDSWAWAHVQVPSSQATPPPGLARAVGQTVSRLVCPRHLKPGRTYRACVVPAFAGGVAAGLGRTGAQTESLAPAWRVGQPGRVTLPVYDQWTFATDEKGGDFEDLVTKLQPADLTDLPGFGARMVDVSEPWRTDDLLFDDRPASERDTPQTVAVQGALRPFSPAPQGSASAAALADLTERLRRQIEAPADLLEHTAVQGDRTGAVAPPLYGGRHRNRDRLMPPQVEGEPPRDDWVSRLNSAVPTRIAAGLGAEYVRANQEDLMARAWEQVGAVREANRLRAIAELATDVAETVHRRHVRSLTPGELVGFCAPAGERLRMAGGPTLAMEVAVSPLPDAAASVTFARMLRPAGALARSTGTGMDAIVAGGLRGSVQVPDPKPVLARLSVGVAEVAGTDVATATAAARSAVDTTAAARQVVLSAAVAEVAQANGLGEAAATVRGTMTDIDGLDAVSVQTADLSALRVALAPQLTAAAQTMTALATTSLAAAPDGRVISGTGVQIDAGNLRGRLVTALQPGDRIARRLASRVGIPARLDRPGLEPVMAYPTFPVPTALALLATDPEWFLPGVGTFPSDRVTLLQSNGPFIESYLAGLNHEMMRELRWREYPTDLRGTPFNRFWPRPDGEPDVAPMHGWGFRLGDNLTLPDEGISVLLVRGAVIRRFPDLVVAAAPAVAPASAQGRPMPDADPDRWKQPLFIIRIDDSTAAYAFEVASGQLGAPGAEGWFFVFQEHSYRIRFGFDRSAPEAFKTWDDLAWPDVPTDGRGFASAAGTLDPPRDSRGAQWGTDAADMARITLQKPLRVGVHASTLITAQG